MDIDKEIHKLEDKVKFKLNSKDLEHFKRDLAKFKTALTFFNQIKLDGVEEAYSPFETISTYLRDDEYVENNSWNFLKNSKKFKDGYIIIENLKNDKE